MRRPRRLFFSIGLAFILASCSASRFFTNPLLPAGADPWSLYRNGYYYYTHTLGNRIAIWKTKDLSALKEADSVVIFQPAKGLPYSRGIWAPEIHWIDSAWYVYFAADDGKNENHRMYVLENRSADPMTGSWSFKGPLSEPSNKWAIDGSLFRHGGQFYFLWSGWAGDRNGQQDIYISRMKNPWTLDGHRVRLSSPTYAWERHGNLNTPTDPPHVAVNEGPQFLSHGNRIFIVYSASGCWTDRYALGLLSAPASADPLDSLSWTKHPEPVFAGDSAAGVYAPGHNSFFKSPDGREDWILYHANDAPGQGCGRHRSPRAQRFGWRADGLPDFGTPVRAGERLRAPSDRKNRGRG